MYTYVEAVDVCSVNEGNYHNGNKNKNKYDNKWNDVIV